METLTDSGKQVKTWIMEEFRLPESTVITVKEQATGKVAPDDIITEITVSMNKKLTKTFSISKPIDRIEREDIKKTRIHGEKHLLERYPFLGRLLRFFGLWFAFSGIYSLFAVCPICGQSGCPVGAGSVGLVGIIFAAGFQSVQYWIRSVGEALKRFRGQKKKV